MNCGLDWVFNKCNVFKLCPLTIKGLLWAREFPSSLVCSQRLLLTQPTNDEPHFWSIFHSSISVCIGVDVQTRLHVLFLFFSSGFTTSESIRYSLFSAYIHLITYRCIEYFFAGFDIDSTSYPRLMLCFIYSCTHTLSTVVTISFVWNWVMVRTIWMDNNSLQVKHSTSYWLYLILYTSV